MKKLRPNMQENEDGIIIIGEHEPPKTFFRRTLHWFGEAILWLLALIPPLLIIFYGFVGLRSGQLRTIRMGRVISGDDAIGFSWMFVGIGLWLLGQACYLKTGHLRFRFVGWVLSAGACGVGLWVLLRRFVQQPV